MAGARQEVHGWRKGTTAMGLAQHPCWLQLEEGLFQQQVQPLSKAQARKTAPGTKLRINMEDPFGKERRGR